MEAKRLLSIVKFRCLAMDEAQQQLAHCLTDETQAKAAADACEARIWRETEAASAIGVSDLATLAFAKWLPEERRKLLLARELFDAATVQTSAARAQLRLARAAHAAAEESWRSVSAQEQAAEQQRTLDELDEITRSRLPILRNSADTKE